MSILQPTVLLGNEQLVEVLETKGAFINVFFN